MHKIVVVGAGVIGLTTAVVLQESRQFSVELWSSQWPSPTGGVPTSLGAPPHGFGVRMASDLSGGIIFPFLSNTSNEWLWARDGLPTFYQLASDPTTGVELVPIVQFERSPKELSHDADAHDYPWLIGHVKDLRPATKSELREAAPRVGLGFL